MIVDSRLHFEGTMITVGWPRIQNSRAHLDETVQRRREAWVYPMNLRTLLVLLTALAIAHAETPPSPVQRQTKGLSVAVVQGDAVTYSLPNPRPAPITIRVTDAAGKPVQNAVAVFELPEFGPSGTLPDGGQVKVVLTDSRGTASVDLRSNGVPGSFEPKITVNYLGQTNVLTLKQENAFAPNVRLRVYKDAYTPKIHLLPRIPATNNTLRGGMSKKTVLILAVVAAAGALGAMFAMDRHGSSSTSSTGGGGITITPGTGSVGGH